MTEPDWTQCDPTEEQMKEYFENVLLPNQRELLIEIMGHSLFHHFQRPASVEGCRAKIRRWLDQNEMKG